MNEEREKILNEIETSINEIINEHKLINVDGENLFFDIFIYLLEDANEKRIELISSNFENSKIYTDVVSSIYNENCSCRGRVAEHLMYNFPDEALNFLNIFKSDLLPLEVLNSIYLRIINYVRNYRDLIKDKTLVTPGEILEVKNDEEYTNLLNKISENPLNFYRGVNILQFEDKLKLYFY